MQSVFKKVSGECKTNWSPPGLSLNVQYKGTKGLPKVCCCHGWKPYPVSANQRCSPGPQGAQGNPCVGGFPSLSSFPSHPIITYHRTEKPQNIFAVHQSSLTQTYLFISKTELLESLYTELLFQLSVKSTKTILKDYLGKFKCMLKLRERVPFCGGRGGYPTSWMQNYWLVFSSFS